MECLKTITRESRQWGSTSKTLRNKWQKRYSSPPAALRLLECTGPGSYLRSLHQLVLWSKQTWVSIILNNVNQAPGVHERVYSASLWYSPAMIFSVSFDVRVMQQGRMKGQAFIGMPDEETASRALSETLGYKLYDKPMVVVSERSWRKEINSFYFFSNLLAQQKLRKSRLGKPKYHFNSCK